MPQRVESSVEIEAPVEKVYDYWKTLENLPQFMTNVEEIRPTGPDTIHWVVKGPLGARLEFDAKTTQNKPNEAIGWNTEEGEVGTSGQVRFQKVGEGRTRVEVQMNYWDAPGGRAGEVASRIVANPELMVQQDLRNLKEILEGTATPEDIQQRPAVATAQSNVVTTLAGSLTSGVAILVVTVLILLRLFSQRGGSRTPIILRIVRKLARARYLKRAFLVLVALVVGILVVRSGSRTHSSGGRRVADEARQRRPAEANHVKRESLTSSQIPERIERQMPEIRRRMASDVRDLRQHVDPKVVSKLTTTRIVERVRSTVVRAGAHYLAATKRALSTNRLPGKGFYTLGTDTDRDPGTGERTWERTQPQAPRYVNTWFESEQPVPPLKERQPYTFKFNIAPDQRREDVTSTDFAEPDFGERDHLDLLLSLYSEDFRIEKHHHHIVLPRIGSSDTGQTRLQPLSSGSCRIELVVSLAKELELLQIIEVNVEVERDLASATEVVGSA